MKTDRSGHPKSSLKRRRLAHRMALGCGVSAVAGLVAGAAHAQTEAPSGPSAAASAPGAATAPNPAPSSAPTTVADAQAAAAPTGSQQLETTVTVRSRTEALVDVPLAISVVSSSKLESLGIKNTTDLANFVPGLDFNNFTPGNARNDRGSGRVLAIRGLILNNGQGASMFLDGAAVAGNEIPASMDIGQVEVLRGPQSVYFGRSTMTGAVSYRTRAIPDQLSGEGEVELGQRNLKNIEATVAGALIPDLLRARLTVLSQQTDGYVTNDYNNGATQLGDQSRKSVSGTFFLTPTASLSFKGYFNTFRDDDGPSATAFVPASLDNCQLGTKYKTFCGEIPDRSHSINYINTTVPANMSDLIFSSPLIGGAGFKNKIGQQRVATNNNIVTNWDISDYLSLRAVTGYHTNITMAALDGFGQPVQPSFANSEYYYTYTQKFNDFSQEVRLISDPEQRFSWTLGTNYISSNTHVDAIVGFLTQPAGTFLGYPQPLGQQITKTNGLFGGAYYKITPKMNLSVEARDQWDHRRALSNSGTTGALLADLKATFVSFSPRVALDYDVGGRRKIYASYATGTDPGGFNTGIAGYTNNPTAFAQIQSLLGSGGGVTFAEEKLKVAELGFKGELDNHKGYFDLNAYMGVLSNQQITVSALIPVLGFSVSGTSNVGESKIHGIEFQGSYNLTNEFSLSSTLAWNYTDRDKFYNSAGLPEFGTTDFSGKKFANVPEFSGSLVAAYTHRLGNGWDAYTNVAGTYRGKEYTDVFNASYIKGRFQADLRAGVSNRQYTVEAYVKNVFNDQNYTGGGVTPDYGTASYYAFFGGWAPPRQFGARVNVKF